MHYEHIQFRHLKFPKHYKKLPRSIKLASIIVFIYSFGWGLIYAFESIYIKGVVGNYSGVGYVFATYYLLGLIFSLLLGLILDKVNKIKIIRAFLIFYLPFSYLFLNIRNSLQFIYFKIYHGIIATGFWVSSEAYIRQHSPKAMTVESMAIFDVSFALALIVGGLLSAFLITVFGFNLFYSISVFSFIALIASTLLLNHKKTKLKIRFFSDLKKEFCDFKYNKRLKKLSLFLFLYTIVSATMFIIFPLFLKHVGAKLWQIGIIFSLMMIPYTFEGFFALIKKRKHLLLFSLFFSSLVFLTMFFISNIILLFFISFIIALCFSAINPIISGKLTETMSTRKRGELSGILSAIRNISYIFSALLSGLISDAFGLNYVFLFNALIFLFLFFLSLTIDLQ